MTFGGGQGTSYPVGQVERQLKAGLGCEWVGKGLAGLEKMPKVHTLAAEGGP